MNLSSARRSLARSGGWHGGLCRKTWEHTLDALAALLLKFADDLVLDQNGQGLQMQDGLPMLLGMAVFRARPLRSATLLREIPRNGA